MNTQTIIDEIKGVLGNLEFPARKDEIIDHAQKQGASAETVQTLQNAPVQKYDSIGDLLSKLPVVGNLEGEIEKFL